MPFSHYKAEEVPFGSMMQWWCNKVCGACRLAARGGRRYFRGLFVIHVIVPESTRPPYCSYLNETQASRFIDVVFALIGLWCQVTMRYIHLEIRVVWLRHIGFL